MATPTPESQAWKPRKSVMKWLLDSDPSIRWQVIRDLGDESDEVVAAERLRVASEGWGAQLLDRQRPDGSGVTAPPTRSGQAEPLEHGARPSVALVFSVLKVASSGSPSAR